jgi:hypothetical protein
VTVLSYPLELYYRDTVTRTFAVYLDDARTQPADLTGVTPRAQIRPEPLSSELLLELVCTVELPNLVHVNLAAGAWPATYFDVGVWDLELTYPTGAVGTLVAGPVRVTPDVTHT